MARFTLEVGSATDVGRQRERNEDSLAVFVPAAGEANPSQLGGLLLVADGMGGERAGDRASQMTAERLREWFSSGVYRGWDEHAGSRPLEDAVERGVRDVSAEIFQLGEADPTIRGLGSTVVLVALSGRHAVYAHVGDSRAYLARNDTLHQLTVDHSWVQRQVDAGVLDQAAARTHPQRNILTRSLGDSLPPEVDVARVDVLEGDRFILCSDGLTGGVSDREMLELARRYAEPQALADALLELANEQDGSDNITVVVGICRPGAGGDLDDESTHRINLADETLDREPYDGDTQIFETDPETLHRERQLDLDLRDPADGPRGEAADASSWRTWFVAALVALALGLMAGYWIQRSMDGSAPPTAAEAGAVLAR